MRRKTLAYIGGTTVILGLGILGYYLYRQYQILRNLCYEFSNLVFTGFDPTSATLGFTMRTTNYSYLPLTVEGGVIMVYIDALPLASITIPQGKILPKAVTFTYLSARVDKVGLIAQGLGSAIDILSGQHFKRITLTGTVKIKVGFMRVNYPIMYSDTVANLVSATMSGQPCPPLYGQLPPPYPPSPYYPRP